jgi:hypothetical protein
MDRKAQGIRLKALAFSSRPGGRIIKSCHLKVKYAVEQTKQFLRDLCVKILDRKVQEISLKALAFLGVLSGEK